MPDKTTKTVYVHAFEWVNAWRDPRGLRLDAGGGGFNWFHTEAEARAWFKEGFHVRVEESAANTADFLFTYTVPSYAKSKDITAMIDAALIDLTATAEVRRIGANVLTYWKRNKFKMGGAKRPARAAA
jgi:hypothetical protein